MNAATMAALMLCALASACSRAPQATPVPASTPQAPAVNAQQASATVGRIHLGANLLPVASLPDNAIASYGITRADDAQLLLVTARDGNGDAIAVDGLQLQASAGSLHESPQPLALRQIQTAGMSDWIGVIPVRPPTTLRVQVQAQKGDATTQMTFSRDFHPAR